MTTGHNAKRPNAGSGKRSGGSPFRPLAVVGVLAVAAAGLLVVLSAALGGGGSSEDLSGVPQDGTTLGREDAPVTIALYEDFQCPACAQFSRESLPGVIEGVVRPGDAKIVARPLTFIGDDSVPAARAALAAGEQDRFWQYSRLLFEEQGAENSGYVTDGFLKDVAGRAGGLDVGRWDGARDDPAVGRRIDEAARAAARDGVSSTPTLVVSGPEGEKTIRGAAPADAVEQAVAEVGG